MDTNIKISNVSVFVLLIVTVFLAGCQKEVLADDSASRDGRIVLSLLSDPELASVTRVSMALTDVTDYSVRIHGKNAKGASIDQSLHFADAEDGQFTTSFMSGTYTIEVDNLYASEYGLGMPYYSGASAEFSLEPDATSPITIAMGKPKNAEVKFLLDESFSNLYNLNDVTLSAISPRTNMARKVAVNIDANDATKTECAYFLIPADGKLTYTIHATAKSGSHAQQIVGSGITRHISIAEGTSYTISLKANPVDGIIIPMAEGTHTGAFDAKKR